MTTAKTTRPAKSRRTAEVVEAPREADLEAAGGVTAVTRALQLLDTFGMHDERLTLAELTRRSGMHKTTALRLLRTLALAGYVVQRDDGEWRLGPAAGWLGARYQSSFDANNVVEPMLLALSQATGESAAFYVREGNSRTCLARVEGPQPIRHHARMGAMLPLDLGSPGRVILAFSGSPASSTRTSARRAITSPSANARRTWRPSPRRCSACVGPCSAPSAFQVPQIACPKPS